MAEGETGGGGGICIDSAARMIGLIKKQAPVHQFDRQGRCTKKGSAGIDPSVREKELMMGMTRPAPPPPSPPGTMQTDHSREQSGEGGVCLMLQPDS